MMNANSDIDDFLSAYDAQVIKNTYALRKVLFSKLPDIIEQIDRPAKMIAYCYGQKYAELICTIIPSKKGLKLGFNRGVELKDPERLLEGTGKISRYVEIISEKQIASAGIKKLITEALKLYKTKYAATA